MFHHSLTIGLAGRRTVARDRARGDRQCAHPAEIAE
jgi:hypothetical protein